MCSHSGVMISIRRPDGTVIECSSPEEVAHVVKELEALAPVGHSTNGVRVASPTTTTSIPPTTMPTNGGTNRTVWQPPPVLAEFYRRLSEKQAVAIRAIATARKEMSVDELATLLGFKGENRGREWSLLLGGCKRHARNLKLEWTDIAQIRLSGAREQRTAHYKAGKLLREAH
jgi:hypothetical protein